MSNRLHNVVVTKKYDKENTGYFNHGMEEINSFIMDIFDETTVSDDGTNVVISKDGMEKGIKRLKEYSDDELPVKIQDLGYSAEEIADIFLTALYHSPEEDEFVEFDWF